MEDSCSDIGEILSDLPGVSRRVIRQTVSTEIPRWKWRRKPTGSESMTKNVSTSTYRLESPIVEYKPPELRRGCWVSE